ncbi:hypothetical protein ACPPVO_58755 [Dactylosporangium sp. McL0621]|uniref:hypothetical protein n=1 Tax=Dactylosporangium sp. McL0621 TaxID=3415678 RepID=UPI003CEE3201
MAAQVVLFGSSSQGTRFAPLTDVATGGIGVTTAFSAGRVPWKLLLLAFLTVLCWAAMWAGALRVRSWNAALIVMAGLGIAGAAATMLLGQDGDSERYFLESARPYLCIVAVAGLARWRTLLVSALAGVIVIQAVQYFGRHDIPRDPSPAVLLLPYAALALVLGLVYGVPKCPPLRDGHFGHFIILGLLLGFCSTSRSSPRSRARAAFGMWCAARGTSAKALCKRVVGCGTTPAPRIWWRPTPTA